MELGAYLFSNGWKNVAELTIPPRPAQYCSIDQINLSKFSQKYLSTFSEGIYLHQQEAIMHSLQGSNVCISTGTASGKTLAFHIVAIEQIVKDPSSKIMAIYPLKALGREQQQRWEAALLKAGLETKVGRIDGNIPQNMRMNIIKTSQVIIFTPDIIHAWFLSNLSRKEIQGFLKKVSLIVLDEVHTYSGVFGSNAAFLFRRLQHLMTLLGASPRYICASATIANPADHLRKLLGLEFTIIGKEKDTSPRQQISIYLVNPPGKADFLTEVIDLLKNLYQVTGKRFITFVDSRKQVELITSIIKRETNKQDSNFSDGLENGEAMVEQNCNETCLDDEVLPSYSDEIFDVLESIDVLPYRAGYEEADRAKIQERLTLGKLSGIVSTSALELGIDIPYLEICILVGVPPSSTSLHQRIGRVGRHSKGDVIVINSGDVYDQAVFSNPKSILERPLAESALYLENPYIQYIHALCLARIGGEHDQLAASVENEFYSSVSFPDKFIQLCNQERSGQIPKELQSMKEEAGENPNYAFPLRDVQSQFKVVLKQGMTTDYLGSLSYSQLMREAYPGAVYYYATVPYRVIRVSVNNRSVEVRKEKRYTTKPQMLPTMIFPNLSQDNIYQGYYQGSLLCLECNLQVRETINGIRERRGSAEQNYSYPLPRSLGFFFDLPLFTRNYFTTGTVIAHPVLNNDGVETKIIANILFEAFLLLIPLERQDVNYASDRFRLNFGSIKEGDKFIAIFDQTYGSLRLTSRIMDQNIFSKILLQAQKLAESQELFEINQITLEAINELRRCTEKPVQSLIFRGKEISKPSSNFVRVIMPGSKGLLLTMSNEEFLVKRVFFSPSGLRYEGVTLSMSTKSSAQNALLVPLAEHVKEIPGESIVGLYDYETGTIKEITSEQIEASPILASRGTVDSNKLRYVLGTYFESHELCKLCRTLGIDERIIGEGNKVDQANKLVSIAEEFGYTNWLLQEAYIMYKNRN